MKTLYLSIALALLTYAHSEASPRRPKNPALTPLAVVPDSPPEGMPIAIHKKVDRMDFPNPTYRDFLRVLSTFYDVRITFPKELAEMRCSIKVSDADLMQILEHALPPRGYIAKLRGTKHIIIKKKA